MIMYFSKGAEDTCTINHGDLSSKMSAITNKHRQAIAMAGLITKPEMVTLLTRVMPAGADSQETFENLLSTKVIEQFGDYYLYVPRQNNKQLPRARSTAIATIAMIAQSTEESVVDRLVDVTGIDRVLATAVLKGITTGPTPMAYKTDTGCLVMYETVVRARSGPQPATKSLMRRHPARV